MSADTPLSTPQEIRDSVRRHARLSFSRSGGKGGQNVNKVSTKVLARVRIGEIDALTDTQRDLVRAALAARINERDEIAVTADDERTQTRNREIALDRLAEQIQRATHRPKRRIRTRTPRRAHETRLEGKKIRSTHKKRRRTPAEDD